MFSLSFFQKSESLDFWYKSLKRIWLERGPFFVPRVAVFLVRYYFLIFSPFLLDFLDPQRHSTSMDNEHTTTRLTDTCFQYDGITFHKKTYKDRPGVIYYQGIGAHRYWLLHLYIAYKVLGRKPNGHIKFADGNMENFSLDNLLFHNEPLSEYVGSAGEGNPKLFEVVKSAKPAKQSLDPQVLRILKRVELLAAEFKNLNVYQGIIFKRLDRLDRTVDELVKTQNLLLKTVYEDKGMETPANIVTATERRL